MIDQRAAVDPQARIDAGVAIGPFSIIGPNVQIGAGTRIGPHVVISGRTAIGRDNEIYHFCSLGDASQDKKYAGEETRLEIGDNNVIREYCTIHRGTVQGGGVTRIGSDNWIMAYVHVAHDCSVGSHTTFANAASLAGHVAVEDFVTLGGFTLIHQFCRVGAHSFTGMGTVVNRDVLPFVIVAGPEGIPRGINSVGLRRRGFSAERIREIKRAYRIVFKSGLRLEDARRELAQQGAENPDIASMLDFIGSSHRSILR